MLSWVVLYLSVFSPLLPIIVGIKQRKSLLWLYAVIGFSFDILSTVIRGYCFFANKAIVLSVAENIFLVTEFSLIALFYRDRIFKRTTLFYVLVPLFVCIYLLGVFKKNNIAFSFIGGTIFDFTCIVFAIAGFYTLLRRQQVLFLNKSHFFWVNVAFLIYCSGNFLVFLFGEYLLQNDKDFLRNLWMFHNVLNVIFSILIAVSFSKRVVEE